MGQGEFHEAALADANPAAPLHIETFGSEAFDDDSYVDAAFVARSSPLVALRIAFHRYIGIRISIRSYDIRVVGRRCRIPLAGSRPGTAARGS